MSTVWTIIGSVGTSLLASGCLVWLFREWISARLTKSIQHEYDKKLADYETKIHLEYDLKLEFEKTEFHKMLDEHQTRFSYWHAEKAKAIKIVFSHSTRLYYNLYMLRSLEADPIWNSNYEMKKQKKEQLKNEIVSNMDRAAQEWMNYRLFLSDKEDFMFAQFQTRVNSAFDVSFYSKEKQISKEKIQEMDSILLELETIINRLKADFQSVLQGKDDTNG